MTGTEAISGARDQIRDNTANPRFGTPKMTGYLINGLDFLWSTHPEAFAENSIPVIKPARVTELSEELPISSLYDLSLVHYMAAKAMGEDAEEAANLAMSQYQFAQEGVEAGNRR